LFFAQGFLPASFFFLALELFLPAAVELPLATLLLSFLAKIFYLA
jgi:hypothetical protein